MRRTLGTCLCVTMLAGVLAGCRGAGTTPTTCGDPDSAVMELRDAWQDTGSAGSPTATGCDECAGGSSKELIRRQGENLAYRNPRHVPTLMFSALTAYEARDTNRAIEHLDDILQLEPGHAEAAILRSRIALEQGNVIYARRLLESQVALNPDHAGLREAHASVCFMNDDAAAALTALDAAERLGAPAYRVAYNRGLIEESRGNETAAIGHYRDALAALPRWAPASRRLRGLEGGRAAPVQALATVGP